jgi:uncharacterized phage protein (TIGR01671 family)|tara:strand:+ start:659 stop:1072 length:414 start_codon:yes stop_codon:yes gene_type:complete
MREIKFRVWTINNAWYSEKNVMYYEPSTIDSVHLIHNLNDEFSRQKEDGFVLMQYTGLKDKNGKEIYEGDVVKGISFYNKNNKNPYSTQLVEWKDVDENSEGKNNAYSGFNFWINNPIELEIIGNIYENPELISIAE